MDKFGSGAYSCTEMASAAHVYGKRILGAEAFTATDAEKWLGHPGNIKDLGDWAFCEGINRSCSTATPCSRGQDVAPGMSMGPWGLHYERTQTWWEQSKAWHEYLARCQFLLQQGLFVADICYLAPEARPAGSAPPPTPGSPSHRPRLQLRRLPARSRAHADDGQGRPARAARRHELPRAGAARGGDDDAAAAAQDQTSWSGRRDRRRAASGANRPAWRIIPQCDEEVKKLAAELWGADGARADGRTFDGKGRVIWPVSRAEAAARAEQPSPARRGQVDLVQGRQSRRGGARWANATSGGC